MVKRYAIANNKYLEDYDKTKPIVYLIYLDANNMYGAAISDYLPTGNFQWIDTTNINLENLKDDGEYGYLFEVDVEYPEYIHHWHSDLPYLPEKRSTEFSTCQKLLTTLYNKKKYFVHYRTLKQAIKHGLVITAFHRGIRFKQSCWLEPYIALNTEMRKNAKNDFERDFYKLMNNAVYGKTMENVRNRINMKLILNDEQMRKMINKSNFLDRTIYNENIAAVHLSKESITMNKPLYVGMAIFDLSKIIMYDFFYNVLKQKYGAKIKLLYMDTDSYCAEVQTRDIYKDIREMKNHFDTSDYPLDHMCHSDMNKKVLGKFKDATHGIPVKQFCGLRPKMYAIEVRSKVIKKIKGVKTYAVKKNIHMNDYLTCLREKKIIQTSFKNIISKKHVVSTVECNKIVLSPDDDKRIIQEDGINTLPYGHVD
jgi:hypothetical protein